MKNLSPDQLVAKYKEIQDPSQKDVLAGLDAVDWQSLKHAHGEAGDVPALAILVQRALLPGATEQPEEPVARERAGHSVWCVASKCTLQRASTRALRAKLSL